MITTTEKKLLALILPLLVCFSVFSQDYFKPGKYVIGQQVKDVYGVVWKAKQNIANAVSAPTANTYWAYVKTVPSLLDSLRITYSPPPVVVTPPVVNPPVVVVPVTPGRIIDVALAYGVRTGTTVDNTAALLRLNNDYKGYRKPLVTFDFRNCGTGEIRYSNNGWLFGIDSFIVRAHGITFLTTSTSPWDVGKAPLYNAGIFWPYQQPVDGTPFNAGFKFNTATKGSYSITLQETTTFTAGKGVYIGGYEEQLWGEPINPRFFEWKTVASVSGNTITFTEPLKWSYNQNWKDVWMPGFAQGGGFGWHGKPRIYKLPDTYTTYAKFIGCTFGRGTNLAAGIPAYFHFKAKTLIVDSCTIDENWPSENETAIFTNCIIGGSDLDKNVGLCEYNNCTTKGIYAATGVDSLRLIRNKVDGYCPLAPRILYAEGNTFTAINQHNIYAHAEGTWIQKVYLKDNTFSVTGLGANDPHLRFYPSSFTSTGATTTELIIPDTDPQFRVVKNLGHDAPLQASDGTKGLVKDIIHNGTNWIIQLTNITGTLRAGQVWNYNTEQKIIDLGGNRSLSGKAIY